MFWNQRRRIRDIETALASANERLEALESERDDLVNLYEKMKTLHARLAKRDQRADLEVQDPVAPAAPISPAASRILFPYGNHR